jgi:hypothetical protein
MPIRLDCIIAALGQPMQALWQTELEQGDVVQPPEAKAAEDTAVLRRADQIQITMLRKTPTKRHDWVKDRTSVPNGDRVSILGHKSSREGNFTLVRTSSGVEGFVKSEHLLSDSEETLPLDTPLFLLGPHGANVQCDQKNIARCANGNTKAWEQMRIIKSTANPGKYLIRSDKSGNHLQCQKDGSLVFKNKNDKLWEQFDIERRAERVFFVSVHTGKVIQARKDGTMTCANTNRKAYEAFRIQTKEEETVEVPAVEELVATADPPPPYKAAESAPPSEGELLNAALDAMGFDVTHADQSAALVAANGDVELAIEIILASN